MEIEVAERAEDGADPEQQSRNESAIFADEGGRAQFAIRREQRIGRGGIGIVMPDGANSRIKADFSLGAADLHGQVGVRPAMSKALIEVVHALDELLANHQSAQARIFHLDAFRGEVQVGGAVLAADGGRDILIS